MHRPDSRWPLAAVLVATLCGPRFVAAAEPQAAPPPANPFFAFCMDVSDAQKRNLEQQATLLKELGYDGAGHLWLGGVPERLQTLDAAGLKLFQIYMRLDIRPDNRQPYDPKLKELLPLLKGRGTMLAVLIGGGKPSDEAGDPRAVELLRELSDLARPQDVRIALYPHRSDWLEKVADAVRVANKVDRDNVGVMFNLCHWMASEDEQQLDSLLQAARPRLLAVSISGSDTPAEIKARKGNWIQPLDSGSYDLYGLLKKLRDLGYRGPVGLQCYGLPGDAREHLARSIGAWRKLQARLAAP